MAGLAVTGVIGVYGVRGVLMESSIRVGVLMGLSGPSAVVPDTLCTGYAGTSPMLFTLSEMTTCISISFNTTNLELYPANTGHCPCVGSMLTHRLRRFPNIEPTHGQCPVFAGYS